MYDRIRSHFEDVRDFVSRRFPEFRKFVVNIGCPTVKEMRRTHKEWYRAYMHTRHIKDTICVHPQAEKLLGDNLYGLFLHEFGHHLQRKYYKDEEKNQWEADEALEREFGIIIKYTGGKELQSI